MARLAGETLGPLAAELGVDVGPYGGLFRYLYLDVAPPSLQSPEIADVPVAHPVQNATIEPGAEGDSLPAWVNDLPDRPVVYVSLGTVFNTRARAVFSAVLDGLRDAPAAVVVTVGPAVEPGDFGPQPPHVRIERFIPQSLLLPRCDAAVNQGGTAILPILAYGLPLLLLPQGANQFHNAAACVAAGVARRLLPDEVDAEAIRREVRTVLHDPALRAAARGVAQELADMPGPDEGVRLIEQLAEERRPLAGARA
jgi:MGT family glycosyltransferase